jgi:glycine hydroxymethyltransferase
LQPGLLSNHHLHRIPALCQTFLEWMEPGESIADRTVRCARALAEALSGRQIALVGAHLGYTGSHTVIIQAQHLGPAKQLAAELENANIIAGSCRLPGKLGPEGLRLGVQEMVRRGMLPEDMDEVAAVIASVLRREIPAETARRRVAAVASKIAERRASSEGQPA